MGLGSKKLLLKRGTYKSQEPPVSSERAPRESEQLLVFTGKACLCSKYVPLLLCCALFQQRERIVLSQNAPLPFLPFSSVSWPSLLDLLGWVYYGGLNSKLRQWQRFIVGRNQTSLSKTFQCNLPSWWMSWLSYFLWKLFKSVQFIAVVRSLTCDISSISRESP